jgi:flagellar biosynthetic protein FliR
MPSTPETLSMFAWEPFAMGFLLVLFRCSSLLMTAPLFGTQTVPIRVRMGISVIISLVAFQAAGMPRFVAWENILALFGAAFTETLIGLATGLSARFIMEAASAAGHAAGLTMGLGFSATIDPMHGQQSDALSQMLVFVSMGVAIAGGMHHEAIAWLCRSFIETPPGSALDIASLTGIIIAEAAHATSLSIRLSFPIMAAVLFGYVGAGLLGRTAPQLNLNNLGFSVALLCGGAAIYYVSPYFAEIVAQEARTVFAH